MRAANTQVKLMLKSKLSLSTINRERSGAVEQRELRPTSRQVQRPWSTIPSLNPKERVNSSYIASSLVTALRQRMSCQRGSTRHRYFNLSHSLSNPRLAKQAPCLPRLAVISLHSNQSTSLSTNPLTLSLCSTTTASLPTTSLLVLQLCQMTCYLATNIISCPPTTELISSCHKDAAQNVQQLIDYPRLEGKYDHTSFITPLTLHVGTQRAPDWLGSLYACLCPLLRMYVLIMLALAVAHLENDVRTVRCLIIGPPDTPYEFGFFEFKAKIGPTYPVQPPSVKCLTTNSGRCRFNPNIYASGKVCLSILGTHRYCYSHGLALTKFRHMAW